MVMRRLKQTVQLILRTPRTGAREAWSFPGIAHHGTVPSRKRSGLLETLRQSSRAAVRETLFYEAHERIREADEKDGNTGLLSERRAQELAYV